MLAYTQVYIKGVVLDSATHEPLSQSLVQIGDQNEVADDEGRFTFNTIVKGDYILYVSHVGCKEQTIKLLVNSDTFITLYLPHHMHTFHEVVTYGHEHNREPEARLITSVSAHKIERIAATNLGDALENTTGIHFLKTGSTIAKPVINGMHSNRISVINDDSKQEGQQWGSEHAPEIDPLSAGSIEVIKGASTLRYGGDAMGGIIRILPATFDDSSYLRFSVLSKLESNPRGGLIGLRLERFNTNHSIGQRLVINMKGNGDACSPDYVLSNTGFRQLSGSYYATYAREHSTFSATGSAYVQKLGILSASHIGNTTDLNLALSSDTPLIIRPFTYSIQPPSQFIQHYAGKLKWELESEKLGEVVTSYTIQQNHRQEFDNHRGTDNAALDLDLSTHQLNVAIDKHLDSYRWQYGVMGENQTNVYGGRYFIPNYIRYKAGAFAVATLEKENYLLEGGLRYDVQNTSTYRNVNREIINQNFNYSGMSANISGWRRFNEDLKMHLSLATRFRSPDINELFSDGLHHGSAALEFGNVNLKLERDYALNAAINYNHNRLKVQVEPYVHLFDNYIYLKPTGERQLSVRGAFPVFRYVQTDARYLGTDADLRYRISSSWILESTAALVYVKDVVNDAYIYGIPAQQTSAKLRYTFAELWKLKNGYWWLGASHTARQNRVEPGEDFTETPTEYTLINTEMGAQYKATPLFFTIGVKNLLNTSYRNYMNRYRYYADDLGISIYLTLNYAF